jgi:hypothetical protein
LRHAASSAHATESKTRGTSLLLLAFLSIVVGTRRFISSGSSPTHERTVRRHCITKVTVEP